MSTGLINAAGENLQRSVVESYLAKVVRIVESDTHEALRTARKSNQVVVARKLAILGISEAYFGRRLADQVTLGVAPLTRCHGSTKNTREHQCRLHEAVSPHRQTQRIDRKSACLVREGRVEKA